MTVNEVLLTISDAARRLGLSKDSVRLYAERGLLPVRRTVGGVRVFAAEDVEHLRAQREAERATRAATA